MGAVITSIGVGPMVQPRVMGVATEANVTVEKAMDQHGKQNTKKKSYWSSGRGENKSFCHALLIPTSKVSATLTCKNVKKLLQKIGTKKKNYCKSLSDNLTTLLLKLL